MLILNRRSGESIWIGENIKITVLSHATRIGIKAPRGTQILRDELKNQSSSDEKIINKITLKNNKRGTNHDER